MTWWLQLVGILLRGGDPVVGARIWWNGTTIGAVSDTAGYFTLPPAPSFPAWLKTDVSVDSLLVKGIPDTLIRWEIAPVVLLSQQTISADGGSSLGLYSQSTLLWTQKTLSAAPCCNLSEAFEGSAMVDAVISNGALGVRQLRLLGFEPAHTPILYENKPLSMGLYAPWTVEFIPVLWIQSLSIGKGVGSVINGFDGVAGQIQAQYQSEDIPASPRAVEVFARSTGEFFLASRAEVELHRDRRYLFLSNMGWTPFQSYALQDHNGDGFLDIPLFQHGHLLSRYMRRDSTGSMLEIDVEGLWDHRWGGEVQFRNPLDIATMRAWGTYQQLRFIQVSLRRGWVLSEGRGISIISQGRYFSQALQAGFNRYEAKQPLSYMQFIYRQPIGDTRWLLKVGTAFRLAHYAESLDTWHAYQWHSRRLEGIGGAFAEFSLLPSPAFSAVLGGRIDWHSYWGWQAVPRFHLHWQYRASGSIRLSAGRAWRLPDPLPESSSFLMSGRLWQVSFTRFPLIESSWSYGFFWDESHRVGNGILRVSVDGLQARITHPFVWDIEKPWRVELTFGDRPAIYQTLYTEIEYDLPDNLRVACGYKFQEVWWPLQGEMRLRPMLPRHRVVTWITWHPLSRRWQMDGIVSWYGPQRLPSTAEKEEPYRLRDYTPSYATFTVQLTHRIDQWEIQLAGENLGGFRQSQPVLAADRPFSPQFDASLIWGPIMGRMASLTVRYEW
ncbi:MAG: TonB-dependent receptor [Bacteroidia bacterium]